MQFPLPERLSRWMAIIIIGILVIRTIRLHVNAMEVYRDIKNAEYASFFQPGLTAASVWIKEQKLSIVYAIDHVEGGFVDRIYSGHVSAERTLYERLSEMAYPTEVRIYKADKARAGDVLILSDDTCFRESGKVLFEKGELRIVRLNP